MFNVKASFCIMKISICVIFNLLYRDQDLLYVLNKYFGMCRPNLVYNQEHINQKKVLFKEMKTAKVYDNLIVFDYQ